MAKIGGLLHVVECGGKGAGAGVRELGEMYSLRGAFVQFWSGKTAVETFKCTKPP